MNKLKELKLKNIIMLLLAGIINAFGVMLFLFPVRIYDSGISGLSMLLDQVTPQYLTISIFLVVLNFPIFIYGLKKQGFVFTIYSLFTICIYSLFSFLISHVFFDDIHLLSPLAGTDLLLCAIFGGVISGIGSGLTIRYGGAIDGIDVLSVVYAKRLGLSIGSFVLIFNIFLYIICGLVINSFILPLYSIITYFIGSKTIDYVVEGFNKTKCAMIVTTKIKPIINAINENFKSSGTIVNATGGYSNDNKQIIYFLVNHFQINRLKELVKSIDDSAFISFLEVSKD